MSAGESPDGLAEFLWAVQTINMNWLAALTISTWNVCVYFDQEVDRIWSLSWRSPMKWAYFCTRHVALVFHVLLAYQIFAPANGTLFTTSQCRSWFTFEMLALPLIMASVQVVLALRVCAIYNNHPFVVASLGVLWGSSIIAILTGIGVYVNTTPIDDACHTTSISALRHLLSLCIFIPIILDTYLMVLTTRKFISAHREGWGRTPILSLVVRDGIWAFVVLFLCAMSNLLTGFVIVDYIGVISYGWTLTFASSAGSRVILNLQSLSPTLPTTSTSLSSDGDRQQIQMLTSQIMTDPDDNVTML